MSESFDQTKTEDDNTTTGGLELVNGKLILGDRVYDADALAKKIQAQDDHIKKLEGENADHASQGEELLNRLKTLEEKAQGAAGLDDVIEKLKAEEEVKVTEGSEDSDQTPAISMDEVVAAATDAVKAEALQQKREANLNSMVEKAKAAYGDDFGDKVDQIGLENNMTPKEVIKLAQDNPTLWMKAFLPEGKAKTPDTSGNGVMTAGESSAPKSSFLKLRTGKEKRAELDRRIKEALKNYQ